mgnify:CR=1 FL=1
MIDDMTKEDEIEEVLDKIDKLSYQTTVGMCFLFITLLLLFIYFN